MTEKKNQMNNESVNDGVTTQALVSSRGALRPAFSVCARVRWRGRRFL